MSLESKDNSLQSTEGMQRLLDLSSVDFDLRIVLGNRINRNKIFQVCKSHSGAPALPEWAQILLSQSSDKLLFV